MNNFFKGKHGPLLIAEIGGNHEGNFEYALKLTQLAIESDVDVIKYQLYSGSTLVNKKESPGRHSHFKKFELSKKQHIKLANMCIKNNVQYSASVWDLSRFDWIDAFLKFYKVGSGDLTAYSLLESIAKIGKPIVLSTGLSNLSEITDTVNFLKSRNSIYELENYLSILQCTSLYPNKEEDVNLNVIHTLKNKFNYPIGYSDHTTGTLALKTAYTMGADILEFHFTDTREGKTFRDHHISLTQSEVLNLIKSIKKINTLKGNSKKILLPNEISSDHITSFRRAIYARKFIKLGTKIKKEDLITLRPNHGIDAREISKLIGKTALEDIEELSVLSYEMFR
tara:strand:- start:2710 stop:3726 length:1017 start_codon:yes stop_codon:yes gene_type:complete